MWKRLGEWWLSRAGAARMETPAAPDPPAPGPELSEKFAKKAHDLDAVCKSVEDSASVSAGLWLSYLFVLLYIGIAAGAVTHRDLLLESPVKLPFLSVDLPLVAFFFLAPILFIVSHAYTLVHFVMLAAKVGVFDGGLGWLLKAIAWITLVIGPVLLLLLIQAQFLPYHLEWVTWVQRVAIVVDLILLWLLWPAVLNGRSEITWPRLWHHPVLTLVSFVPIGLAFTTMTFPGEALDYAGKKQWIPPNPLTALLGATDEKNEPVWTSFHDLVFNGQIDNVTRRRKSLFSNTLVLPWFDALEAMKIDDHKIDTVKHTLVLRSRHLESAVFNYADFRKVDLTGAQLEYAWFIETNLQGASLENAQLQGASLDHAQLQGASLAFTWLQGASLKYAKLQGALLPSARLQGAWLFHAQLQGAFLDRVQLQGAMLEHAGLQGGWLGYAQLQGASLYNAQLHGANLWGAALKATWLEGVYLWRTQLNLVSFETIRGSGQVWEDNRMSIEISRPVPGTMNRYSDSMVITNPEPSTQYLALKNMIKKEVSAEEWRDEALRRIEILDPAKPFAEEPKVPGWRSKIEAADVEPDEYAKALADQLRALVCSGDANAPYIVRGLINNDRIEATGAQAPGLVEAILKPDCPVSAAVTAADKAALEKLKKEASAAH